MKSEEEYLVNKTVDAVNEAQKQVNNWWIGNVGTNLYEQYGWKFRRKLTHVVLSGFRLTQIESIPDRS